jgi:hypothetical protein
LAFDPARRKAVRTLDMLASKFIRLLLNHRLLDGIQQQLRL